MLWAVQHNWTSGKRFTFNCYLHWATLVIWDGGGAGPFLYSMKGVTQGYPIAMITYGIVFLPSSR